MQSPTIEITISRRAIALYAALFTAPLLLTFVLRYPSLYEPRWYGDEGIFAAVAENMRHGRTLYSDAWDNKPPLIFFTYAGVQSALGPGIFPLHLVTTIVVLATQFLVTIGAAVLGGARRALLAAVLFALAMGTPVIEANLAMTETFMILATSLAALIFITLERRATPAPLAGYLAIGVLIGIASNYKQVAVFDGAAVALMIWLTHTRPLRALAAIAGGFSAPHAAFVLLFLVTGALPDYWYAVIGSLGFYTEIAPEQGPLIRFAGYLPALIVVTYLMRRRQLGGVITLRHFPMLWLGFTVIGVTSSSFPFPHYMEQAVPPLALVVATATVEDVHDDLSGMMLGVGGVLVVALALGQFSIAYRQRPQLAPVDYYRTFISYRWGTMTRLTYGYQFDGKVAAVDDISEIIHKDGAGTTAYSWSEFPWLYPAGDLTNPTRYYTSFLGELVPGAKHEILNDLVVNPPVYIVVADDTYAPFRELESFLEGRYALLRAQGDWRLYRLSSVDGNLEPEVSAVPAP